ncbi:MAG: hypothetical protein KAI94_12915 [Anaerolineales bacterium]|nr:hypothetical protein [Anaerolineales bacterium]
MTHSAGREESACEGAFRVWEVLQAWVGDFNSGKQRVFDQILPTLQALASGEDGFEEWASLQVGARSPLEQLRNLLIRLSEHWRSYRVFDWQKRVPWINNGSEQAIGRMKMCSCAVRGYKSWRGMQAAFWLTGSGLTW